MPTRRFPTLVAFAGLLIASELCPAQVPGAEGGDIPKATAAETSAQSESSSVSLHDHIDQLIRSATPKFAELAAPVSSDDEFVRRAYLDIAGTIPTAEQTREFLADESSGKRLALIDQLLASPQHARRLQYVFDEMLMERRAGADIPNADWQQWLRESFHDNKPWNQLVTEILTADGVDEKLRPAAKFYLDRKFDVDLVTRDIGRVFLGVDLECAQCHDHPNIDDYLQRHYYGLSAFLKRSYLFTDPESKKKVLGEKAEGDVKFTSVFTQEEGQTDPHVLDLPGIPDPEPAKELYIAKPASKVRGIPTYSRRLQLATAMVADNNVDFRQNIVNRLWALMMGRGLVEPLDIRHTENPPSHPEVLDLLADEFLKHQYDVRWLLRELALTETYQRSSNVSAGSDNHSVAAQAFACGLLKPLSPEQLAWSSLVATGVSTVTMNAQEAALLKAEPEAAATKTKDLLWREEALDKALKPELDTVVARFAGQGGQKTGFEATANQALFLINGPNVEKWLKPQAGVLTDRLQKLDSPTDLAEELYVSVLSRLPSEDETAAVTSYVESVSDRATAIREMTWALLSSAEFRFNH
ncbi:MAG: DUF1553 domain-containing protein [Rhodopirellula sp.]|nr:DUF1553 domain-containing protein [Rhodopirellula sp.]